VIHLLKKGTIRDLRLDRMGNWNAQTASECFQTIINSRLQVFWCLSSHWGALEVQLLAQVIQQSQCITDIRISVTTTTRTTTSATTASSTPEISKLHPIATALRRNRTLTNLGIRLVGEEHPSPTDLQVFLDVLQNQNYTLKDLIVARGTQWDADQRRHIPTFNSQAVSAVYENIDFYLSLNRAGRASLLQENATAEQLLQVIASQWSLSLVYYFLRWNPTLFLTGVPPPCAQTQAQERAALLQRFTLLFPETLRQHTLTLLGPRQVQDALVCLPVLGVPQHSTNLHSLTIRFVERGRFLNWEHLTLLLECLGAHLQTLSLEGVILDGLGQYNEFETQLSRCHQLSHFSVHQCNVVGWNCDSMANALSGLNQLESLEWMGNEGAFWRPSQISQLLQSRPIKFLALDRLPEQHDWNHFFELLQQSTSLRVLRCELDGNGFSGGHLKALGRVLALNSCSLENLRIHVQPDADLKPLAAALRTNRSLTGLHLTGSLQPIPDLSAFSEILETSNSTLKSLIVGTCDLSNVSSTKSGKIQQIGVLLQSNIARSRPPPLLKPS
jgi:hypothetical protein